MRFIIGEFTYSVRLWENFSEEILFSLKFEGKIRISQAKYGTENTHEENSHELMFSGRRIHV